MNIIALNYAKSLAKSMSDLELIERFQTDPEEAYLELLERYTPVLLRMIRTFMKDVDEMMEVYTGICERLCANQHQALRRFRSDGELVPWLSVVVANACRDRFRKTRAQSVPQSVIAQLDECERLVFKYHYQEHLPHEDIAEVISRRHRVPYTALEVVRAIAKINDLLSTRKRWLLLAALSANHTEPGDQLCAGFDPTASWSPGSVWLSPTLAAIASARPARSPSLNRSSLNWTSASA